MDEHNKLRLSIACKIASDLIKDYQDCAIYLCGSVAAEQATVESDIDLCLIISESSCQQLEEGYRIRKFNSIMSEIFIYCIDEVRRDATIGRPSFLIDLLSSRLLIARKGDIHDKLELIMGNFYRKSRIKQNIQAAEDALEIARNSSRHRNRLATNILAIASLIWLLEEYAFISEFPSKAPKQIIKYLERDDKQLTDSLSECIDCIEITQYLNKFEIFIGLLKERVFE